MINSSPPARSGWNNWFFLPILLVPLFLQGQDPQCTGRYQDRILQASSLIAAGHYGLASVLLQQLEPEVLRDCPADSAALSDIACLAGNLALLLDDPQTALDRYREARAYANGLLQLSRIDQNTGSAFFMLGDYDRAVRYFSHALSELEHSGSYNPSRMVGLYDNMGAASFENGDTEEAGKWWELAATTAETGLPPDSVLLAGIIHNSGLVAFAKCDWLAATRYFQNAIQLYPGSNMPFDRMNVMIRKNLSVSLMKENRITEAESALAIFKTDDPVFRRSEPVLAAEILRTKAWISFSSGRRAEADNLIAEAAGLAVSGSKGSTMNAGNLEQFRLRRDKAAMLFLGPPDVAAGGMDQVKEIFAVQQQAFSQLRSLGNSDGSCPDFILRHDSVDILLSRTVETGFRLIPSEPEIAAYLLMCLETFNSRRFRADAPMQDRTADMPPDSLTEAWLRLNRQLYLHTRREIGSLFANSSIHPDQENRKFRLGSQLDSIAKLLRERYPGNSLVSESAEERMAEVISQLSDNEAILEYLVVPGQVYVFIIRNDGVRLVRSLTGPSFMSTLAELISALRTADDRSFREKTREVSRTLIDPVSGLLNGVRRLYILPGRDLESVPFESLLMNGNSHLCERFAITYHLSLTEVTPDRHRNFKEEVVPATGANGFLAFSPAFTGDRNMHDLGNAAAEVDEIGRMFSASGYASKIFTESNADEQTLLREAGNGSIVHIATHARVDRRIPERSGLHLWKQAPAVSGDELIDGILEMGEVKGMRFRCSLLTLSSCGMEPAGIPGQRSKINLQADFLDAGAQRVLYSLWSVSDRHTRTLMCDFYRNYLNGDDFPEALRKAKVKMMNNPATASPYFWAAFILGSK